MERGEKITRLIDARGYSDSELARRIGVSPQTVGRWRDGKEITHLNHALKLARLLNVSLEYLADDALDTEPASALSADELAIVDLYRALALDRQTALRALALAARAAGQPPYRPGDEVSLERPETPPSSGAGAGRNRKSG